MVLIRRARESDAPAAWALKNLPNVRETADSTLSLDLPRPDTAPLAFPDLSDVVAKFIDRGGDFIAAEHEGEIVGMGGYRPTDGQGVEILRVRVHPALRRIGLGRAVVGELERGAAASGHV